MCNNPFEQKRFTLYYSLQSLNFSLFNVYWAISKIIDFDQDGSCNCIDGLYAKSLKKDHILFGGWNYFCDDFFIDLPKHIYGIENMKFLKFQIRNVQFPISFQLFSL